MRGAAHQRAQAEPRRADRSAARPLPRALAELTFSRRRIANDVKKVLQAAIANAENNHQLDVDRLYVKEATVGRAFALKRFHARGRGRAARVEKYFAHLTVIVREREDDIEETA